MAIDMLPGNLVFDLDGTLLDSLPGIRYSLEAAFRACGLAVGEVDLRSLELRQRGLEEDSAL